MNSNLASRFASKEPTVCAVCRRHAWSFGYHRGWRAPIVWLCDARDCHAAAKEIYAMPQRDLDALEFAAAQEAGEAAGGYLEKLGTTDLARLNQDQWFEFLRLIVTGFEETMRRRILKNDVPF